MSFAGKLFYRFYYQPRNKKAIVRKFGGAENYAEMIAAEQEMKAYALNDLQFDAPMGKDARFRLNFLTGENFIHQTLFCTYSFFRQLTDMESAQFTIHYYDDGTLSDKTIASVQKRFPAVRITGREETSRRLQEYLPESAYPYLNKNARRFPLFRKLIYPNAGQNGLRIFFDSDMLFLRKPGELLNWLDAASTNRNSTFAIEDVERSYGYTDQEIFAIWPYAIPHNINSGLYAMDSSLLDWQFIEDLAKKFELNYGAHYYLEQLITAIMLQRPGHLTIAPKAQYIVFPSREQVDKQYGTLHHYVNESKEHYFKESWKLQLR